MSDTVDLLTARLVLARKQRDVILDLVEDLRKGMDDPLRQVSRLTYMADIQDLLVQADELMAHIKSLKADRKLARERVDA